MPIVHDRVCMLSDACPSMPCSSERPRVDGSNDVKFADSAASRSRRTSKKSPSVGRNVLMGVLNHGLEFTLFSWFRCPQASISALEFTADHRKHAVRVQNALSLHEGGESATWFRIPSPCTSGQGVPAPVPSPDPGVPGELLGLEETADGLNGGVRFAFGVGVPEGIEESFYQLRPVPRLGDNRVELVDAVFDNVIAKDGI
jgi:hypothetical protein